MKRIDERTYVSGQVGPGDLPAIKAAGVAMIVNNRPDGEEPGQPAAADIETAVRTVGLDYRFIPVASGFSADQVDAMTEALDAAEGPVLAFCRSGTRSTFLWALARTQRGEEAEELMRKAAAAGYDLRPIGAYLKR